MFPVNSPNWPLGAHWPPWALWVTPRGQPQWCPQKRIGGHLEGHQSDPLDETITSWMWFYIVWGVCARGGGRVIWLFADSSKSQLRGLFFPQVVQSSKDTPRRPGVTLALPQRHPKAMWEGFGATGCAPVLVPQNSTPSRPRVIWKKAQWQLLLTILQFPLFWGHQFVGDEGVDGVSLNSTVVVERKETVLESSPNV